MLLSGIALIITSCNTSKRDKGVVINGVKWATRNVGEPGTFVKNPEDAGMFYQWNRKTGWSSTDPLINSNGDTTWDSSVPSGNCWEKANDPCPPGWRIPTLEELQSLINAGSEEVYLNVKGYVFGKVNNRLFFPSTTGYRLNKDDTTRDEEGEEYLVDGGTLFNVWYYENAYWSSTSDGSQRAYAMSFDEENSVLGSSERNFGFSVRCVSEASAVVEEETEIQSCYEMLVETANEINKSCPMMLDSYTRLDNAISLPPNIIQYNYTLINCEKEDFEDSDLLELKREIEPIMVNNVRTNPDLQYLRDNDVIFNYYYRDLNGVFLLNISIPPEKYK